MTPRRTWWYSTPLIFKSTWQVPIDLAEKNDDAMLISLASFETFNFSEVAKVLSMKLSELPESIKADSCVLLTSTTTVDDSRQLGIAHKVEVCIEAV